MNLDVHLNDKVDHNGPFTATADFAQSIKFLLRRGPHWDALPSESKEVFENIATQIARILHGDHARASHWNKIAGWARLRGAQLEKLDEDVAAVVKESVEPEVGFVRFAERLRPRLKDIAEGGTEQTK